MTMKNDITRTYLFYESKKGSRISASLLLYSDLLRVLHVECFSDDDQQNEQYQDCTCRCEWVVSTYAAYVATTTISYFAHVIASSSSGIP